MYSRLIHTVDHVKGELREGFDALDAFLAHTWAVTVTGAPKAWAMQFLEDNERTCRAWYGGSVGHLGFDGNINTGLTLRTIRIVDGVAQVRAGATLLFDSDPPAEEAETVLKASAFIDALRRPRDSADAAAAKAAVNDAAANKGCAGKRILLVDHQVAVCLSLARARSFSLPPSLPPFPPLFHTHTHTHTLTLTHTHTRARAHTHIASAFASWTLLRPASMRTGTQTHRHANTQTYRHTDTADTRVHAPTALRQACAHVHVRPLTARSSLTSRTWLAGLVCAHPCQLPAPGKHSQKSSVLWRSVVLLPEH